MEKVSAGLLMYKKTSNGELLYFIGHPGGPFWKKKMDGVWGIPKGEVNPGEKLFDCAKREFLEETGIKPQGEFIELGSVRQLSGKIVHAWAFEGDWEGKLKGNSIAKIEWPRKSGKIIEFPEMEKAEFCNFNEAKKRLNPAQVAFIERLREKLG